MENTTINSDKTIFHKYYYGGYREHIHAQKPKTKHPHRIVSFSLVEDKELVPKWIGVTGWQSKHLPPSEYFKHHRHYSGVCIKTAYFPAIDIDCEDPNLVQQILTTCYTHLGQGAMVRTRQGSNRLLLLYRTDIPFKKLPSVYFQRKYRQTSDGNYESYDKQQVDFLSIGSHCVLEGVHPSGNFYELINFTPAKDLLTATAVDMHCLQSELERMVDPILVENHPTHRKSSVHGKNIIDLDETYLIETINHGWITCADIIDNPEKYHGEHCRDPYEPNYKREESDKIGRIYTNRDRPCIHSFAHGWIEYMITDTRTARRIQENG